jgi:ketosteroid isomerase-like protein
MSSEGVEAFRRAIDAYNSGVDLNEPFSIVAEFHDGLVLTLRAYLDHAPTLEAIERHDRPGARD